MNENGNIADESIMTAVRERLSKVEALVPPPPAWCPPETTRATTQGRTRVRVREAGAYGFGAAMVVTLLAVVVAFGLSARGPWAGGPASVPKVTTFNYQLDPVNGVQPTIDDLNAQVTTIESRVKAIEVVQFDVTAQPPNRIVVSVQGPVDRNHLLKVLGQMGRLVIVPLPPETYGKITGDGLLVNGTKPFPALGGSIDPALPILVDGTQIDRGTVAAVFDEALQQWSVKFRLNATAVNDFATWSGQHIGEYLTLDLDGRILEMPFIQHEIADGSIQVSGGFSESDARDLAAILQSGELLPMHLLAIEVSSTDAVGPSQTGEVPTAEAPTPSTASTTESATPTASSGAQASQYAPSTAGATTAPAAQASPTAASSGAG
jgi:hypothetical protein